MKIYQVGGCVRDVLLHRQPHDKDYVVVGSSVEEMLAAGYQQVGRDFPVFLHPETKEEYALARKERKIGDKHTDFEFVFTPDITLAEDMQRRDFTVNALARDIETSEIADTVGGLKDLQQKIIRHVNSEHFGEDPLRVLRMCRFAAQLNFTIAPETMQLAKDMVNSGMLEHLTPERIWKEIEKALQTEHFEIFIKTAKECGALKVILPEVDELWNIPEKLQYHPEGNTGEHTMLAMKNAELSSPKVKFALLLHDIGKILTPEDILPAHHEHDKRGLEIIEKICRRLQTPNNYRRTALCACNCHMKFALLPQMKPGKILDFVKEISHNFRDAGMMDDIIEVCRCDMSGKAKKTEPEALRIFQNSANLCREIFTKVKSISATEMPNFSQLHKDKNFGELYRNYLIKRVFQTE